MFSGDNCPGPHVSIVICSYFLLVFICSLIRSNHVSIFYEFSDCLLPHANTGIFVHISSLFAGLKDECFVSTLDSQLVCAAHITATILGSAVFVVLLLVNKPNLC